MSKLFENWRRYLKEGDGPERGGPVRPGGDEVAWVQGYFDTFEKNTKQMGHIPPPLEISWLPQWLRKGAEGVSVLDFAPSYAWYTTDFAKALGEISEENSKEFRLLFLLLADAIDKNIVNPEYVLRDWWEMAQLVYASESPEENYCDEVEDLLKESE